MSLTSRLSFSSLYYVVQPLSKDPGKWRVLPGVACGDGVTCSLFLCSSVLTLTTARTLSLVPAFCCISSAVAAGGEYAFLAVQCVHEQGSRMEKPLSPSRICVLSLDGAEQSLQPNP